VHTLERDREREGERESMAKKAAATVLVKLLSQAGTGYFYVARKNPRKLPQKLEFMKYDPRVRRHVLFSEVKLR